MIKPQPRSPQSLAQQVGHRVRELRIAHGISSQEALGDRAGLHRTFIGRVERGETNVTVESLARISGALGVSLQEFFRPFTEE